ncbi:acetyl-CoA carboxylase biotin carboxylase subunit family protein [Burkholderia cepacia]|uniref:ATP-grasp domain-containing protein n=1 Tax=Burkholderia cepacia TaxID=292 RepID=A0AAQ0JLL7_BURCE|nr:hypothetical protein [Burkholderia cepacia]MCE4129501.1 hypothetical protein [Burkholderia cepacia]MDN7855553.1 hypothetical protein [Burkholderia cepacia]RAQ11821.1 hypothetical protein DPR02_11000 [Burkholderia cepacia]
MKILILHQAPFKKMRYDLTLDHREHDLTYIGLDKHLRDLPTALACRRIVLPPEAEDDLVRSVLACVSPDDRFQSVIALSEYGILEACRIRAALGIAGPSYEQIELVRDKVKMKRRIAEVGSIRYPRFIETPGQVAERKWQGRTISKPRDGASSRGIVVHDSFDAALDHVERLNGWDSHEIEEYIDAPLYHFDGVVVNGELDHFLPSRYLNTPLAYLSGEPVGSFQVASNPIFDAFCRQVVEALEIRHGCIHIEAFFDGQTCIFLEAANRLGGARIVETHQLRTGVHLPSIELSDYLQLPAPAAHAASPAYYGFLLYPGHHRADLPELVVPDDVAHSPLLIELQRNDGPVEQLTYDEAQIPLSLVARADSPEQLEHFLCHCLKHIGR